MGLRALGASGCALTLIGVAAWAVTYAVPGGTEDGVPSPTAVAAAAAAPVALPAALPAAAPAAGAPVAVDQTWVARIAAASGISPVAVSAYGQAVLGEPTGCDLGWTTLAGIGWVESEQGTIGGRYLEANGRPSTAITGPALDGVGFAAVPATASGTAEHGDRRWDHAVGPMQFLPSTWARWGRDGDGDGTADPQDLQDAAAAATAYLCGTDQDLATGSGWTAAVLAYNHSEAYVHAVYAAAETYADRTSGTA